MGRSASPNASPATGQAGNLDANLLANLGIAGDDIAGHGCDDRCQLPGELSRNPYLLENLTELTNQFFLANVVFPHGPR